MFVQAYNLLREILCDETLNAYIFSETGKHLVILDAGAQITSPSAKISLINSSITYSHNSKQEANYRISFALPFWGTDALEKSHHFLDIAIMAFFNHELGAEYSLKNEVLRINPTIEEETENELWTVTLDVAVSIFI